MIHLRKDYDGIQDTMAGTSIQPDEPVFILRAKDPAAKGGDGGAVGC